MVLVTDFADPAVHSIGSRREAHGYPLDPRDPFDPFPKYGVMCGEEARLGGITGDTLGAATNLVDLAVIAAVVALARAGML